jgi:serine/threonine-protein kinase
MIGQTISHYRIAEKLGEGGMGVVYKAEDLKLGRAVALKLLPPHLLDSEEHKARFLHEARAAALLDHPNICTVYEIDEVEGRALLAMACLEGQTLKQKIAQRPLPLQEALDIAVQIGQGLQAAHEKGIVHRDIKPANIMISPPGQVKIMDFGLAQLSDRTKLTATGSKLGTPAYMSPEQTEGKPADRRSDIWALGVVLYEMISGRVPFPGEAEAAVAYAIVHTEPELLTALRSGVPLALDRTVEKALAKDPAERYQHVEDLLVDLRALLNRSQQIPRTAAVEPPQPRRRPAWTRLIFALLGLAGLAVGIYWLLGRQPPQRDGASVAVLPFANLSGQEDQEYLSDSFTDTLISELGFAGSLRVISRTSVMPYKGTGKPLHEIARELDASHVIEGAVLRAGDRVRVTTSLIDATENRQMWSKRYERDMKDLLALQNEVAQSIVSEIRVALTPQQQERLTRVREFRPEAHELYLKGRYLLNNRRTEESRDQARQYLEQAVDLDPTHALAYAALSHVYGYYGDYGKMKEVALRAIELDDSLAEAYARLGFAQMNADWDWDGANASLERSLELNPSSADAHHFRSHYLMTMGNLEESLVHSQKASELAPFSLNMTEHLCWNYMFARDYDRALENCKKVVEMEPNLALGYQRMGLIYIFMGDHETAIKVLQEAVNRGRLGRTDLAYAYAVSGRREQALRMVEELKGEEGLFYGIALVYVALGDKQGAIGWLNRVYEQRGNFSQMTVHLDPRFDSLHSEPGFRDLMRKLRLTP